MAFIEDGTGSGYVARVTRTNRILGETVSQSAESYANTTNGQAYHIPLEVTPTGPNQVFFYMKNTSTLNNIVIEGFDYRVESPEVLEIYSRSVGTPAGTTDATPINANTNSAKTLSCDSYVGVEITGLSDGELFDKVFVTSVETKSFNFNVDFVVGPGGTIVFRAVTGLVPLNITIQAYEEVRD